MNPDAKEIIESALSYVVSRSEVEGVAQGILSDLKINGLSIEQDWRDIDDAAKTGDGVLVWFDGLRTPVFSRWCGTRKKFLMGSHKQPTKYKLFKLPKSPTQGCGQ